MNSISLKSFILNNYNKKQHSHNKNRKIIEEENIDYKCLNLFLKNTLFLGATGCGKTLLLKLLIMDLIEKKQQVVILNPRNEYNQFVKYLGGITYSINNFDDILKIKIKNNLTLITLHNSCNTNTLKIYMKKIINHLKNIKIENLVLDEMENFEGYALERLKYNRVYISTNNISNIKNMKSYYDDFIIGTVYNYDLKYLDILNINDSYYDNFSMLNRGQFILSHNNELNKIKCFINSNIINMIK